VAVGWRVTSENSLNKIRATAETVGMATRCRAEISTIQNFDHRRARFPARLIQAGQGLARAFSGWPGNCIRIGLGRAIGRVRFLATLKPAY